MIKIFNGTRLTRQPFFVNLVNYLFEHEDVTLRQIKQAFEEEPQVDKLLDSYISAGYVIRENRRYYLADCLLGTVPDSLALDQEVLIDNESKAYEDLLALSYETDLSNETNQAIIVEHTGFARDELTLSNYFYKLRANLPMSDAQEDLYAILGDVNPEYALKYMTTFLLKFARKDLVKQKRPDIFVNSLLVLGYLKEVEPYTYSLEMDFDEESMVFKAK